MGYHLRTSVGRGAFGEVWRAFALREEAQPTRSTRAAEEATEATPNTADPTRPSEHGRHPDEAPTLTPTLTLHTLHRLGSG